MNISTINDHFQIKLKPNKHLLSPGFKVYHRRHGVEGHVTTEDDVISTSDDTACHFHGVIESHGQAKAALSLCRGVVSLFQFVTLSFNTCIQQYSCFEKQHCMYGSGVENVMFSEKKRVNAPRLFEPRCEKTGFRGFRPDPTQTGLYSHRG